jgi:tRNA/rRNA methyltransferase
MAGSDATQVQGGVPGSPAVVLVDPQLGENIGTAARAMLNCGLTDLRLVRPRDGWPNSRAQRAAAGADVVLDGARLYDRTEDAIADLSRVYATTARHRFMTKPVVTPRQAAAEMRAAAAAEGGARCGVLFGRERTGLENDDVALADAVLTVPLNPGFTSLNLAQAVLLIGYEWYTAGDATPARQRSDPDQPPASKADLVNFFEHLEQALDGAQFFRVAEKRPSMVRSIRNLFQRTEATAQEVRTLHGIVTALTGRHKDGRPRRGGPD